MKLGDLDFAEMEEKHKVIYKGLWENRCAELEVEPTSENAKTTYKLSGKTEESADIIKESFHIENTKLFDKKYKMAVSGNGNEEKKILTMHSSSLCALLTFYNLDQDNTIALTIDGKEVTFNCSVFEFKNPVIGYPSNMDIVLLSEDRKTVLFLESKFSEYYTGAGSTSSSISKKYLDNQYGKYFYEKEWLDKLNLTLEEKEDEKFVLKSTDGIPRYLDGFKQMISHYIGIRNRLDGKGYDADNSFENAEIAKEILEPKTTVYLGEILFDKFVLPEGSKKELDPIIAYNNYSSMYREFAKKMNAVNREVGLQEKFIVLEENLKYSDIFKAGTRIDSYTREFYGME